MKKLLLVSVSALTLSIASPAMAQQFMDNINSINQQHNDVAGVYQVGSQNTNITNQNGSADGAGNFDWTLQIAGDSDGYGDPLTPSTSSNSKDLTQTGDGNTNLTLQGAFNGSSNDALITQSGLNNNADTIQYGVAGANNSATISQTGDGNSSLAIQAGVEISTLGGGSNTLTVIQENDNNTSNAFQGAHDGGITVGTVNQTGNGNTSNLFQSDNDPLFHDASGGSYGTVNQSGDGNTGTLFQVSVYGGKNTATLNQSGDTNDAYLFQMAGEGVNNVNDATITQSGDNNEASALQVSFGADTGNLLTVDQQGDDNSVSSVQYAQDGGGNTASITQAGNNNTAINMQVNYIPGEGAGADYTGIITNLAHVTPHPYVGGVGVYSGIETTPLPTLEFSPTQPNIGTPGVNVGAHTVTHTITIPNLPYKTISLEKPAPTVATPPAIDPAG